MHSIMSSLVRRSLRFSRFSPLASKQQHQSSFYSSWVSSSSSSSPSLRKLSQDPLSKLSLFRFFSSSSAAKKIGADEKLKLVIQNEIQCAEEQTDGDDQGGRLPDGFPFEIIDNPGEQTIILKREFAGESIQIEVHMPEMAEEEDDKEDSDDDDDDDKDDDGDGQFNISLIVTVVKGDGPRLEFCCTAFPDEITIDSMLTKGPEDSSNQIAYEGPEFSDLDENLQKSFHEYLEVRGIKSSLTNFLQEYMIKKDNREYLMWLKNMKGFVEK